MTTNRTVLPEESLDPEDWEAMRALGHRMVDDMLDHLIELRERPAWQHAPQDVNRILKIRPRSNRNPQNLCTRNFFSTYSPTHWETAIHVSGVGLPVQAP